MKKSLILVGMLVVGYANAQEGNVGINTEVPKATLEVLPSAKNLEGTTNEGIVAPKLTKARIANIAEANLVEGTLVYATDITYTGNNAKVAKITEKGYYFYNGTEWVKVGTNPEEQLWAQRDNNGITEIYLKPATSNGDEIYYSKKEYVTKMGGYVDSDADWKNINGDKGYGEGEIPYFIGIRSAALPPNSTLTVGGNNFNFSNEIFKVEESHASAGSVLGKTYWGKEHRLIASDVISNLGAIRGLNSSVDLFSSNNTDNLNAGEFITSVGNEKGDYTPTLNGNVGLRVRPRIYPNAKVTTTYGLEVIPNNYGGSVTNMYGIRTNVNSSSLLGTSTVYPTTNYTNLIGNYTTIRNRQNTTTTTFRAMDIQSNFDSNSTITGEAVGLMIRSYSGENSNINTYIGVNNYFNASGALTMKNFYGFRFTNNSNKAFNPENMYGLYLANINQGTTLNYAIYSNDGKVRFGDLKGTDDRVVYADKDGVLKTGSSADAVAGKIASTDAMQCNAENRGKMNFIPNDEGSDVFGICLRNKDGNYYWGYMVGGNNPTNGTGAFGSGL